VDGKTRHGSGHGDQDRHHLLAALDQAHGAVLGQAEVGAKTNEVAHGAVAGLRRARRPVGGAARRGLLLRVCCFCFGLAGGERPLGAVPVPAGQLGRGGWFYKVGPAMR
jgi:hypothetical protein